MVEPIILSFLDGINGTVMVYGPTGAGKTYTILGSDSTREKMLNSSPNSSKILPEFENENASGVLFYAAQKIFEKICIGTDSKSGCTNVIKCSYIEIYNDSIYDLLQEKNRIKNALSINENEIKEFIVKDAIEHNIRNIEDFINIIQIGERIF